MSDDKYPSQQADRFQVRLPDGLRNRIRAVAERNARSMNAEIVLALESWLDWQEHGKASAERGVLDQIIGLIEASKADARD